MSQRNTTSQYERKLARQRQLDLMEAAATGTAPTMELDTSAFESPVRSRRSSFEEEIVFQQPRQTESLFGKREAKTSVNLMDHDTGVYSVSSNRFQDALLKAKALFFRSENDAGDAYLGDEHVPHDKRRLSSACALLCSTFQSILSNPRRRMLVAVLILAVTLVSITTTTVQHRAPSQKVLRQQNSVRFNEILSVLENNDVSPPNVFLDYDSAEYHALRWLSYSDPARLAPTDPNLVQRYALVVLFYQSFLAFEKEAGRQAPIEFSDREQFEGVPNPGWIRRDGWLTQKGICAWWGVECVEREIDGVLYDKYNDNAAVTGLNLTANNVYGTLPKEIGALDSLMFLDLSKNKLHGTFPATWPRPLFQLKMLFLQGNELKGEIPTHIGFFEALEFFRLDHNQIGGSIPTEINRMAHLREFDVGHNQMTGGIPDMDRIHNLQGLHVNNNLMNADFPFTIAKSQSLLRLYMQENQFKGTLPPEIENLRKLQVLQVNNNNMTGPIVSHIFQDLDQLQEVRLDHNTFSGPLPHSAGDLTKLRILMMNNNKFTGDIPEEWDGEMANLQVLHLHHNQLDGTIPLALVSSLPNAREMWLNDNLLHGEIPKTIGIMSNLETLYVENNKLMHKIPLQMRELVKLKEFRVYGNTLTGTIPVQVCTLKEEHALEYIAADCHRKNPCKCCNDCY